MSIAAVFSRLNRAGVWRRRVRVLGFDLTAASMDRLLYLWLHRLGLMGAEEEQTLRRLIQPGMRVVDVGANVGVYTLLMARLTGAGGRVFAFEPEPTLFSALSQNCIANGAANVTPMNCALGADPRRVRFFRSAFNSGDNRLGGFGWTAEAVEVELARLDDVLPDPHVDLVKMDVQGYELKVLCGMEQVLALNSNLEIYLEFWPHGLTSAGDDPADLLRHLRQRGFRIFLPSGTTLQEVPDGDFLRERLPGKRFTNLLASRTRKAGVLTPAASRPRTAA